MPWYTEGLFVRDMGFGASHAVDGAVGSAWCTGAHEGSLRFTLPAASDGLTIVGGQRSRWRLGPMPCRDASREAHWADEGFPAAGCMLEGPEISAVPASGRLEGPGGTVEVTFSGGLARIDGTLSPGAYTLAVAGPPDGPRGVCVAELTPDFRSEIADRLR